MRGATIDSNNFCNINVFNTSSESGDFHTLFISQDGSADLQEFTLLPGSSTQVSPPSGFLGATLVGGDQEFNSSVNWNLTVMGSRSKVGVPPLLANEANTSWTAALGDVGPQSEIGIAIYNMEITSTACDFETFNDNGSIASSDDFQVPGGGQTAQFANTPPDFCGGSQQAGCAGSAKLSCDGVVIPIGVFQGPPNGFPTPLFFCPTSDSGTLPVPMPTPTPPA